MPTRRKMDLARGTASSKACAEARGCASRGFVAHPPPPSVDWDSLAQFSTEDAMDRLPPFSARTPDSGVGHFRVTVQIGNRTGERFEPIEALVDTGATYTWVPREVLTALGVTPEEEWPFVLADEIGRASCRERV